MAGRAQSKYEPERIETKWQKLWDDQETFVAANPAPGSTHAGKGADATYVLEMFPYPSGSAHMGHVKNYTMGDIIARFRRHQGQRVLHPMGYDAFGLNSENMAIKTGEPPAKFTEEAIGTINRQLRRLGVAIDWTREVVTSRPEYYKMDAVAVPAAVQEGPCLQEGGPGQLVSVLPDRVGQRAGHRRAVRAM